MYQPSYRQKLQEIGNSANLLKENSQKYLLNEIIDDPFVIEEEVRQEPESRAIIDSWKQEREKNQNQVATLLDVQDDDEDTSTIQTWKQMQEARQNQTSTLLEDRDDDNDEDTSCALTSTAFAIESTGGTAKSNNFTYKLVSLKKIEHLRRFENLIFPNFKQQWSAILERSIVQGVVAYLGNKEVGLVLVEISPNPNCKTAEIVSWFVLSEYRQQGIGCKLIRYLEKYLLKIHCDRLTINYQVSNSTQLAVEKILKKLKWQKPAINCLRFKSNTDKIAQAFWLNQFSLPKSFSVVSWSDLSSKEISNFLKYKSDSHSIAILGRNERVEKLNSLVLYRGKQLIGWIINHRIASDTIRYSSLYIQSDLATAQLKIALLSESIKRQINSFIPYGDFMVVNPQASVLKLIYRYLKPYNTMWFESRQSSKKL
ncbi:MAG: hypothetical protein Tsb0014_05020 [Pleurocapsa sp.]